MFKSCLKKEVSEELGDPTDQYDDEKEAVLDEYKVLKTKINPLNEILNTPDFQNASKTMRNSAQLLEYLLATHGIPETIIDDVYNYAKETRLLKFKNLSYDYSLVTII